LKTKSITLLYIKKKEKKKSTISYILQNILSVSTKLETLDKRLEEKTNELSKTPTEQQQFVKEEI